MFRWQNRRCLGEAANFGFINQAGAGFQFIESGRLNRNRTREKRFGRLRYIDAFLAKIDQQYPQFAFVLRFRYGRLLFGRETLG